MLNTQMRHTGDDDDDDDNVGQKRYLTKEEGTVVQEHSKSNFDPTPKRPARPHSSDRTSHLDHHAATTRARYILPHNSTRVVRVQTPPRALTYDYDMLHFSAASYLSDCTRTWLSEAVPPKRTGSPE